MNLIAAAESGYLADSLVRLGIRRLLDRRLSLERKPTPEAQRDALKSLIEDMRRAPVAPLPEKANDQHYEVPAAFFRLVLGPQLKYSSGLWEEGVTTLAAAEEAMLALSAERAELADGQDVLELGCGWGSLTLWMAEHFPRSRILAVSNSGSQRAHIESECARRAIGNVSIETADMNVYTTARRFDRVVSIEMFEHMRNYELLLARIASWLKPQGKLFVHHFCHRTYAYPFGSDGEDDWMGRNFFSGGLMPSEGLLSWFQRDLQVEKRWRVEGDHYARTAEAWLGNLDRERSAATAVLAEVHGAGQAAIWRQRWRMFFMACAELFGRDEGREWFIAHYRMVKPEMPS